MPCVSSGQWLNNLRKVSKIPDSLPNNSALKQANKKTEHNSILLVIGCHIQ